MVKGFAVVLTLAGSSVVWACGGSGGSGGGGADSGIGANRSIAAATGGATASSGSAGAGAGSSSDTGGTSASATGGGSSTAGGCPTSPECQTCLQANCASQLRGLSEEGQAQNDFNTVSSCLCAHTHASPGDCEQMAHAQLYFPVPTCAVAHCAVCGF